MDVKTRMSSEPFRHVGSIELTFDIPRDFPAVERQKLEKASGLCPVKASLRDDTVVSSTFNFASAEAA